jgi:hypothetical protein
MPVSALDKKCLVPERPVGHYECRFESVWIHLTDSSLPLTPAIANGAAHRGALGEQRASPYPTVHGLAGTTSVTRIGSQEGLL